MFYLELSYTMTILWANFKNIITMKKEDVLALCSSEEEKQRVESVYMVSERFRTTPVFEKMKDNKSVKEEIKLLVVNYEKRCAARDKSKARKEANKKTIETFTELLMKAKEAGVDDDEIIFAVKKLIKDKYNQGILDQIQELQKKMME